MINCGCKSNSDNNGNAGYTINPNAGNYLDTNWESFGRCPKPDDEQSKIAKFSVFKQIAHNYIDAVYVINKRTLMAGEPCLVRYYKDYENCGDESSIEMVLGIGTGFDSSAFVLSSEIQDNVTNDKIEYKDNVYNLKDALLLILERMDEEDYPSVEFIVNKATEIAESKLAEREDSYVEELDLILNGRK